MNYHFQPFDVWLIANQLGYKFQYKYLTLLLILDIGNEGDSNHSSDKITENLESSEIPMNNRSGFKVRATLKEKGA